MRLSAARSSRRLAARAPCSRKLRLGDRLRFTQTIRLRACHRSSNALSRANERRRAPRTCTRAPPPPPPSSRPSRRARAWPPRRPQRRRPKAGRGGRGGGRRRERGVCRCGEARGRRRRKHQARARGHPPRGRRGPKIRQRGARNAAALRVRTGALRASARATFSASFFFFFCVYALLHASRHLVFLVCSPCLTSVF